MSSWWSVMAALAETLGGVAGIVALLFLISWLVCRNDGYSAPVITQEQRDAINRAMSDVKAAERNSPFYYEYYRNKFVDNKYMHDFDALDEMTKYVELNDGKDSGRYRSG